MSVKSCPALCFCPKSICYTAYKHYKQLINHVIAEKSNLSSIALMSTAWKFRWVNIQNPSIDHAHIMKRLSGAETWVVKRVLFLLVDKAEKSSTVHRFTFRIHFHNWNLYSQTGQLWTNTQCKHNTISIKDRGSKAEGVGWFYSELMGLKTK